PGRLRAPPGPARPGHPAREGVRHPHPHELLDLPPMSDTETTRRSDRIHLRVIADARPTGRSYWKSLEELARDPAGEELLLRECPEQASFFDAPGGGRHFLPLMGASRALAGLTACTRQPEEKIVPYVKPPEDAVPGRPLFFATAVLDGGYAKGVLVESH